MNYTQMHIKNIIQGKIGKVINPFIIRGKNISSELKEYTLVKDLTPSYSSRKNRVGLYDKKNGKKVVIKRVYYGIETLDVLYARNEAFIMKTLSELEENNIAPKFVEFFESPNHVGFATEYFEGKNVETVEKDLRAKIALKTFEKLKKLSRALKKDNYRSLPVRRPFYYLVSFFFNIIKVIAKNPLSLGKYLKLAAVFYRNYLSVIFGNYTLGFVHRDLFADNLLYSEKDDIIKITDWESALVSDELYDIAQIAMIYLQDLGTEKTIEFVQTNLKNNDEKRRFIALGIFNAMQILTNINSSHPVFKQTQTFLNTLLTKIAPQILYKKSPFEIVNGITLNLIYLFYKVTKLQKYSKEKRIILCYHSIGNNGWRFACRTDEFKNHLDYLHKNAHIVSLPQLMEQKKGGITFTFDDGYLDVLENAFPLLEKVQVKATMFALADESKANRVELDNLLPIMTIDQLKHLHKSGWEIGSHTTTHSHLAKISDAQLEEEIITSKKRLQERLGSPIRYLAYPKGIYSKKIIEYVKKAQYELAFTVDGYDVAKTIKEPYEVSRISIDGEITQKQFEALLSPLGVFVSGIYMQLLKIKESLHIHLDKS